MRLCVELKLTFLLLAGWNGTPETYVKHKAGSPLPQGLCTCSPAWITFFNSFSVWRSLILFTCLSLDVTKFTELIKVPFELQGSEPAGRLSSGL